MEIQSQPAPNLSTKERARAKGEALARLVRDTRLSHGAVRLFMCLYLYWNEQTGECFPGQRAIRKDIGCSASSITGWVAELVSTQWAKVREEIWPRGVRHVYTLLNGCGGVLLKPVAGGVTESGNTGCAQNCEGVSLKVVTRPVTKTSGTTNSIGTNSKEHKGNGPKPFLNELEKQIKNLREAYSRIDLNNAADLEAIYSKLVEKEKQYLEVDIAQTPERKPIDQDPHLIDLRTQVKEAKGDFERATEEQKRDAEMKLERLRDQVRQRVHQLEEWDNKLRQQIRDGTAKPPKAKDLMDKCIEGVGGSDTFKSDAPVTDGKEVFQKMRGSLNRPDRNAGTANEGNHAKYDNHPRVVRDRPNRNIGTANEGTASDYRDVGKIA